MVGRYESLIVGEVPHEGRLPLGNVDAADLRFQQVEVGVPTGPVTRGLFGGRLWRSESQVVGPSDVRDTSTTLSPWRPKLQVILRVDGGSHASIVPSDT